MYGGRTPDVPNGLVNGGLIELIPCDEYGTGVTKGTAVDTSKCQGRAEVLVLGDKGGGTTPTADVVIEHSDTNVDGDFVTVPAALKEGTFAQGTASVALGPQKKWLDVSGCKRWVRAKLTVASSGLQGFPAAVLLLAAPRPNIPTTSL